MGISTRYDRVPETDVHELLRNQRRRNVIKRMKRSVGSTTLRELAVDIAELETSESPPPKGVRDSVYNSLHQTHLPKLDQHGVIEYDRDRKTITLTEEARALEAYMDVVTAYGITWSEFYRLLGTLALVIVLLAIVEAPVIGAAEPLVWTTAFLAVFALVSAYQLWTHRWVYLNALVGK